MNGSDPKKRAQWEAIPHEGEIPTPEEWLYYAVNILIENGDEDLLRWYPNLWMGGLGEVFILGDMYWEYGDEKRVCTPFDVVLAFFVSVLIVLKFVGEYGNDLATF